MIYIFFSFLVIILVFLKAGCFDTFGFWSLTKLPTMTIISYQNGCRCLSIGMERFLLTLKLPSGL